MAIRDPREQLLFAGRDGPAPDPEAVRKIVTTVISGVVPGPERP